MNIQQPKNGPNLFSSYPTSLQAKGIKSNSLLILQGAEQKSILSLAKMYPYKKIFFLSMSFIETLCIHIYISNS